MVISVEESIFVSSVLTLTHSTIMSIVAFGLSNDFHGYTFAMKDMDIFSMKRTKSLSVYKSMQITQTWTAKSPILIPFISINSKNSNSNNKYSNNTNLCFVYLVGVNDFPRSKDGSLLTSPVLFTISIIIIIMISSSAVAVVIIMNQSSLLLCQNCSPRSHAKKI